MNPKQSLKAHLRRFSHLRPLDIDTALRRIFDWGEDQSIVLSEIGLSHQEIKKFYQPRAHFYFSGKKISTARAKKFFPGEK